MIASEQMNDPQPQCPTIRDSRRVAANARTLLALARGVSVGAGCRCRVCGPSPFDAGGKLADGFTDFPLLADPSTVDVCAGCAALLAGRPGDTPPPLRTTSIRATDHGAEYLDRRGVWAALLAPLEEPHVLSWAVGGQRHHWLRAGVSTSERLLVGTDEGTVEYVPARDRWLLDAVHALLASPTGTAPLLSRESIRTGIYHPAATVKYGVAEWTRIEEMVAAARPSPLLDMAVACAPVSGPPATTREDEMISEEDARAAELLAYIAHGSAMRSKDGLLFWSGVFRHRIEQHRRKPLADFVSRMLDAVKCDPVTIGAKNTTAMLEALSPEDVAATEKAVKERPALLVALAFDRLRAMRDELSASAALVKLRDESERQRRERGE